jgi:hypothetical protein
MSQINDIQWIHSSLLVIGRSEKGSGYLHSEVLCMQSVIGYLHVLCMQSVIDYLHSEVLCMQSVIGYLHSEVMCM